MEPFLADLINNKNIPKVVRYILVVLLCTFIIVLGVLLSLKSELLFGKIFGIILTFIFLVMEVYLIIKIKTNKK